MGLTIIGLGLADVEDITLKGLKAIEKADYVYLETYTSMLIDATREELESFYKRPIIEADRIAVEQQSNTMLTQALEKNVVLLVGGDPLCATTHADLCLDAINSGVKLNIIHNASVMSSVGSCGLQLYRFGETVSIPFFEDHWRPNSFFTKIMQNQNSDLHTLCLLDIRAKEQTVENMMADRSIFEPPRFMSISAAIKQLLMVAGPGFDADKIVAFGIARLGSRDEFIVSGNLAQLSEIDFGRPLHSLVICAPNLHDMELKFYEHFRVKL